MATEAGVIAAGAMTAFGWGTLRYGVSQQARTMTFGSLVIAQLLHALTCRSASHGPFAGNVERLPPNRALSGALALSFAAQGAAILVPGVRRILGIAPLGALDVAVTALTGVAPYLVNEASSGRRR